MHSTGCFGSPLAFDKASAACQACKVQNQCAAEFKQRRPKFLRMISKFSDSQGERMTFHWLNKAEKKKVRELRKQAALEEAASATYGDIDTVTALKANMHQRAHVIFDKMVMARINVQRHDHETVGTFSKAMRTVLAQLKSGSCTLPDIASALVSSCSYSAQNARREAQALTSILIACDRAKKSGHKMELK